MALEDFSIIQPLGKGSFGSVVKVVRKSNGQVYAMKQIKLQKLKEKDKKNALNQIRFLASINHPNIVSYRQAFYDEETENLCVVMDFANGGDLQGKIKKHIKARIRINQETIWRVAYEVIEGLNKLHESNIIHRDIKPANIFFNDGLAKIGDLNVAKHLKDPFTVTQTGTPYYASPQVWNQEPYQYKSDVWSLGCVLYEMAALKPPFRADTAQNLYKKVLSGQFDPIPSCYSKQLLSFIKKLLQINQKIRPGCRELLAESKILQIKKQIDTQMFDNKQLLQTIKFPNNLKQLNLKLPKSQYDRESNLIKSKTSKVITSIKNINQNMNQKQSHHHPTLSKGCSLKTIEGPDRLMSIKQMMRKYKKQSGLKKVGSQRCLC